MRLVGRALRVAPVLDRVRIHRAFAPADAPADAGDAEFVPMAACVGLPATRGLSGMAEACDQHFMQVRRGKETHKEDRPPGPRSSLCVG